MDRLNGPLALDLQRGADAIFVILIAQLAHNVGQVRKGQPHLLETGSEGSETMVGLNGS